MYIEKTMTFSAGHIVHTTDSPCSRLHGHNWKVKVELLGSPQEDGMVVDFIDVKKIVMYLDHRMILPLEQVEIIGIGADNPYGIVVLEVHGKQYHLPGKDCRLLPIPVATAEHIARWIAGRIKVEYPHLDMVIVTVNETESSSVRVDL